ncbi:5-carboxymethyl-2-hydroxymuconate Delta-isomerase [Brevundimonas sp. PAMC22021]|uniref:5-carboxymethyl-2-hydroxymuconate Delta-isomerase n=1 Tax=Brevundimonas sp. PAMC22021 TaxID=2861285 RepID=UPI001C63659B|nr:isomerase [Brevundimonas sp. PAMC22021]QYF87906.1 isomerase [Brevundimonas sp. PAMC22021]
MPQITLEFSKSLDHVDWRAVALDIHNACVDIAETKLSMCKTRLVRLEHTVIADGAPEQAMAHCEIRLLPGRTADQKSRLGDAALERLQGALSEQPGPLSISCEVLELDGETYRKVVRPA